MEILPGQQANIKNYFKRLGALASSVLALGALGGSPSTAQAQTLEIGRLDEAIPLECGNPPLSAPKTVQERTLLCLINRNRAKFSLQPLVEAADLDESAALKTRDEIRFGFSHNSGDKPWNYYIPDRYKVYGEDLIWGLGNCGTAMAAYGGLMHSSTHRSTALLPYAQYAGVAMQRYYDKTYWTLHIGGLDWYKLPPAPEEVIEPTRCLAGSL